MFVLSSEKSKWGFTIIEFLVVFGIIGIITTLSIASYNTFTESFKLKNEVQNAIAVLSLAQKRAVAGEDAGSVCPASTFDSFVVSFTAGGGYTMQGKCVSGVYGSPVVYTIDAANKNISILDTDTVTFNKLTGSVNTAKSIRFKNTVRSECAQITIATTGIMSTSTITCP